MTRTASFSLNLYGYHPSDVVELARHAERLGFEGLWFGEHYVVPEQYGAQHPGRADAAHKPGALDEFLGRDVRLCDPWLVIAAAAAVTQRLKFGTAITIVPMTHPLQLARAVVTAHDVSGGRVRIGCGAGWLREEFDAFAIPFTERGSRLDESVQILRRAWAGGFFSHQGRHFSFASLQITPEPVRIPFIAGGNTPPALRRAAREGDGWINSSSALPLAEALALRDSLESHRRELGVAGREFAYYIRTPVDLPLLQNFVREGFCNLVLPGAAAWPKSTAVPLEEKVAGLERLAAQLGL